MPETKEHAKQREKHHKTLGGVTHGVHHGVPHGQHVVMHSRNRTDVHSHGRTNGGPATKWPSSKAAHAHTVSVKKGVNWVTLQQKYFPGSSGSFKQGNIIAYNQNLKKGAFVWNPKYKSYYTTGKNISV